MFLLYNNIINGDMEKLNIKQFQDNSNIEIMQEKGLIEKAAPSIYIDNDFYEFGVTEIETSMGNNSKVYDIERCICDIIRSKNRMDLELIKYSVKEYIKRKDKDLIKLSLYTEKLGKKEIVMDNVGMMYE